jgi:hypothetical protein
MLVDLGNELGLTGFENGKELIEGCLSLKDGLLLALLETQLGVANVEEDILCTLEFEETCFSDYMYLI